MLHYCSAASSTCRRRPRCAFGAAGAVGAAGAAGPCDGALTHRPTAEVARVLAARALTVMEQGAPIEHALHEVVAWYLAGQDRANQDVLIADEGGTVLWRASASDMDADLDAGMDAGMDAGLCHERMTQREQARASTWQVIDDTLQVLRSERSAVVD